MNNMAIIYAATENYVDFELNLLHSYLQIFNYFSVS